MTAFQKNILCDPQTSGGLLVAVDPDAIDQVQTLFKNHGLQLNPLGEITEKTSSILVSFA
jgi:selenide,water dikinase